MFFLYTFIIALLVLSVIVTRYIFDSLENYYLVTRVYNVLEYSLLSYVFYLNIKNKVIRNILLYSIVPYTFFCIYSFIVSKEPSLAFFPLIFEYLVLLLFIIYFFFEVLQETLLDPIYIKPIFWISVAFIINFSGNFFLLLTSVNSFQDQAFRDTFTIIYSSVTILKNILLCIAVSIKDRTYDLPVHDNGDIDVELDQNMPFKIKN